MTTRPDTGGVSRALLGSALWFGIVSGWCESLLRALRKLLDGTPLILGPDLAWMPAAANAINFFVLALAFWPIVIAVPRLRARSFTTGVFAGLGAYDVLLVYGGVLGEWTVLLIAVGVGMQVGRFASAQPERFGRLGRRTLGPFATVVIVAAVVLRGVPGIQERIAGPAGTADASHPNVLLLVLDTARALNMSVHGYPRPTTPSLERLAARGTRFDFAVSPSPWTLPGHASLFTGQWPHQMAVDWRVPLDDSLPTLAETFRAAGYRTGGIVANLAYVRPEWGVARGFLHYETFRITPRQVLLGSRLGLWLLNQPAIATRCPALATPFGIANRPPTSLTPSSDGSTGVTAASLPLPTTSTFIGRTTRRRRRPPRWPRLPCPRSPSGPRAAEDRRPRRK